MFRPLFCVLFLLCCLPIVAEEGSKGATLSQTQIIDQATAGNRDGHRIETCVQGARISCALQAMEGILSSKGLSITSIGSAQGKGDLAVQVQGLGRGKQVSAIESNGKVSVSDGVASLQRASVSEEVRSSAGGIRQDFIVHQAPSGQGELTLALNLPGAAITACTDASVSLHLDGGRDLTWHSLQVIDADNKTLCARFQNDAQGLSIRVDDHAARYPLRIDPTFTDANWVGFGAGWDLGTHGTVYALAVSGSDLFVGGDRADHIVKWNGSTWSNLGSGTDGTIYTLAISGSDVYAGGHFRTAGGVPANFIAKWDGNSWSNLGSGMDYEVMALAVSGSDLYAGGWFRNAGGVPANYIAKWNGSAWSSLSAGVENLAGGSSVYALAVFGSNVYVGGTFSTAGGVPANNIAKWNGITWSNLGAGMDETVNALAVSDGDLYAGGWFKTAGGVPANYIAKWNGITWAPLGTGMNNEVKSIAISGSDVYVGGYFEIAGGITANKIAKWNGSTWSVLGSGIEYGEIHAIVVSGSDVYAGGYFTKIGGVLTGSIAKWNGSFWFAQGAGMNSPVYALAVSGSDLYAAGNFWEAGGVSANYIAKWNGSRWTALGSGTGSIVNTIAVSGNEVYVGGEFEVVDGKPTSHIAKWSGDSWSNLGLGVNGSVETIAVSGNNVYAGGYFTMAGGISANRIAKWNGSSWSALGSGMNAPVITIAVSGGEVYAGGLFTTADGIPTNRVAKWNGSNWSSLSSGVDEWVGALAVSGSDVYVGGGFKNAGGISAKYIAKWNGISWSVLDSGMNDRVSVLLVCGTDVYVGGSFTRAGEISANHIAKWNGSVWSALGSGTDDTVSALAFAGNDLFVGGYFSIAGGRRSDRIARAIIQDPVPTKPIDINAIANQVAENAILGTPVGITAFATCSVAEVTYQLSDNAGGRFAIDSSAGVVTVTGALDYETAMSHQITIIASANGISATNSFIINVSNVNEVPLIPMDQNNAPNQVVENAPSGTPVGIRPFATDPDAGTTLIYSLSVNPDNLFAIDPVTHEIVTTAPLNFESTHSYSLTVQVSDGELSNSQAFTVAVLDANDSPSQPTDIDPSLNRVAENSPLGATVGILVSAIDPDVDSVLHYRLLNNAGGRFAISATTGVVTVAGKLDYETSATHAIIVEVSDGNLTNSSSFVIEITDANEAPSQPIDVDLRSNCIAENSPIGATVGITVSSTDPDVGNVLSYRLLNDAGGRFAISATTGVVTVAGELDYETSATHAIIAEVSDGTLTNTGSFEIEIMDVNEPPSQPIDIDPSLNRIAENSPLSATVGIIISATDPDFGSVLHYRLLDNAGGRFAISATTGVVTVAGELDYETSATHAIIVEVSDGELTNTQTFVIEVTDVDEGPSKLIDTDTVLNIVTDSAAIGSPVHITAHASDPDANSVVTYSLGDNAGGRFAIDAHSGVVTIAGTLDHTISASHAITVVANSGTLSATAAFTILVEDGIAPIPRTLSVTLRGAMATDTVSLTAKVGSATASQITLAAANDNGRSFEHRIEIEDLTQDVSITYTATDSAGNVAIKVVRVSPSTLPTSGILVINQ